MTSRGRRIAAVLVGLALVLSAGRWLSVFLTERLWESTVSEAVAVAGMRRALLGISLELVVLILSAAWFVAHLAVAARAALPDRAPPETPKARVWPARLPRWTLTIAGVLLGVLVGGGAGRWLDELLLTLDGFRFGVGDPLLGADLGFYLRDFPLWLELHDLVMSLVAFGLAAALAVYTAGGAVTVVERRIWVSPKVRGHLAILLSALALALAWGSVLEEFRLAAGLRGPLVQSEFLLRSLVAQIQAGIGAAAAVISFLWWVRFRGAAVAAVWAVYGLSLLAGRILPLGTVVASKDETWRGAARGLDSVAFELADLDGPPLAVRSSSADLTPTLWDEPILERAASSDSATVHPAGRGWIVVAGQGRPVWFAVRESAGRSPALLALADDRAGPSGELLSWRESDSVPALGTPTYRAFHAHGLRPTSPPIDVHLGARGIVLDSWPKRLVLAWALQVPQAFSVPSGSRLGWRLDPAVRLRAIAPFAQWSRPRPRVTRDGIVWTSDGMLTSTTFPSSGPISWGGSPVSMVRGAFLGTVDATTGVVRVFRSDPTDSLAAAWARITGSLIEAPGAISAELRAGDPYPEELVRAQARVLGGPAWDAGRLERDAEGGELPLLTAPGGGEVVAPLLGPGRRITAFLLARRTLAGDSVHLIRLDSAQAVESASALGGRWVSFPFQQGLRERVLAVSGQFVPGRIRYAIGREGIAAYQPIWEIPSSGPAHLVMVNVMLGGKLGTGHTLEEAWRNQRGQFGPIASGRGPEAILEEARRWILRADSARNRGDLPELQRALAYLKALLNPPRRP